MPPAEGHPSLLLRATHERREARDEAPRPRSDRHPANRRGARGVSSHLSQRGAVCGQWHHHPGMLSDRAQKLRVHTLKKHFTQVTINWGLGLWVSFHSWRSHLKFVSLGLPSRQRV